jgi:hypoxanthine-DNA glycosylase
MKRECLTHPFAPLFDNRSEILILGSFPSAASRKISFYYGNPHNRFWPLLALVFREPLPQNNEERGKLALRHHLALYDVISRCSISGSADASIQDVVPLDLSAIDAPLRRIVLNGSTAGRLYERFLAGKTSLPYVILPSTSPANAAASLEQLAKVYGPYLKTGEKPVSL